jgi:hypothetical protein
MIRTWGARLNHIDGRALFISLFALHLTVTLVSKTVFGISITDIPDRLTVWDWYWQTLPYGLLRDELLTSIWHLHAQPPLFNLFGGVLIKLFGPGHLEAMHYTHALLGALACGMLFIIAERASGSRPLALIVALAAVFNPALILYEGYMLYTVLTTFLIVLLLFWLALYAGSRRPAYLYAFVFSANLLVLTRSLYHPLFLLAILALVALLATRRRTVVIAALICTLGFGWASKNAVQFGFFGTSSWGGLNLWRAVSAAYDESELDTLAAIGIIDPLVIQYGDFTRPISYVDAGFNRRTPVRALANNDYNNINMPDIAAVYGRSAGRLLLLEPGRHLDQIAYNYTLFACPSTRYKHLTFNAPKIAPLVTLYEDGFYAAGLFERLRIPAGPDIHVCSALHYVIPGGLFAYGLLLLAAARYRLRDGRAFIQRDALMVAMWLIIGYTVFVGAVFEVSENVRFKFPVELPLWAFTLTLLYRGVMVVRAQIATRTHTSDQAEMPLLPPPSMPEPPAPYRRPWRVIAGLLTFSAAVLALTAGLWRQPRRER